MANSLDPDQTAPIGVVCSGSTMFASILNASVILGNYLVPVLIICAHGQIQNISFMGGPDQKRAVRTSLEKLDPMEGFDCF